MRKALIAFVSISLVAVTVACASGGNSKAASPSGLDELPDNWGATVTVKDLTDEITESAARMGQNLKKPSDYDKYLKIIKTEGHLVAVLAALVQEHPEAGGWKSTAAQIREQGLIIAKAAEAKGRENFKAAQDAHKRILDSLKKKEGGDRSKASGEDSTRDWGSLGALGDVMKRVEPSYKYIRGKMSNEAAFKRDSETIRHNAALLYIFAQISPAFRPTESDMPHLSGSMATASLALIEATKTADFAKANEANTAINNSCNECHKAKRFNKKGSDFDF
jgi:hypothetical protein